MQKFPFLDEVQGLWKVPALRQAEAIVSYVDFHCQGNRFWHESRFGGSDTGRERLEGVRDGNLFDKLLAGTQSALQRLIWQVPIYEGVRYRLAQSESAKRLRTEKYLPWDRVRVNMSAPTIDIPPAVQSLLREYLRMVMQPLCVARNLSLSAALFLSESYQLFSSQLHC